LQNLTLGAAENGEGYYYLDMGSLLVGGHETLGLAGLGILFQGPSVSSISSRRPPSLGCTPPVTPPPPVSPPHSVGKNLYLGRGLESELKSNSHGGINLSNSSLTVGGAARVGIKGTGLFEQTDSIVKIKGNYYPDPPYLQVGERTLSYSPDSSALSKKNLKNNKLECVSNRDPGLIVGLENVGSYNLSGGSLNVNYSEIIGLGSVRSTENKEIDGMGYFLQTDGTHTINGNLYLGKEANGFGEFYISTTKPQNLDTSVGLLDVHGFASVGYLGEGLFTQYGGTVKIRGIDQEVNLKGKSLSTTLSKGQSLSCSQHQYIGFTVGRGGTGDYYLADGELLVSRGEIIGMRPGSNGVFEQIGGKHFIGGNLTIARDPESEDLPGSKGLYTLKDGTLKVQGSLLNNEGGTFKFYGGEFLASAINKGTFNAYGPETRAFPKQFFNYGTFEIQGQPSGTASFAQKFRNYGVYKSTWIPVNNGDTGGADSRFTYLYVADQGYIVAGPTDNYYVTKEFTNNSSKKAEWKTDTANLIFTGPGRKPFKTGSDDSGDFDKNFAWGSVGIDGDGSVRLLGHLYADQIRGIKPKDQTNKIANLFGYCGIHIYYDTTGTSNSYLNEWILTTPYGKPVGKFTSSGFETFKNCY